MAPTREEMENLDLGALVDHCGEPPTNSNSYRAAAELERRRTVLQEQVAKAQIEAAEATKETATYTQQNARYMLWSVIVLALGSIVTAGFSIWDHFSRHF